MVKTNGLSLFDAFAQVSAVHPIKPNAGFAAQLVAFEVATCGGASVAIDGFGNWRAAA